MESPCGIPLGRLGPVEKTSFPPWVAGRAHRAQPAAPGFSEMTGFGGKEG